jgi:CheY-like chemotaxis protein
MGDDHRPAELTGSLLARKGSAAPSFAVQRTSVVRLVETVPREASAETAAGGAEVARFPDQRRPRVVVVAADALGRKLLRALVAAHGCEVAMLAPDDSPIAHIVRSRPDLVIIDLDMGQVAGRELAVRIKAEPELRATSVAAVIDLAMPALLGYDALLAKPLAAHDVVRMLGRLTRPEAPSR